MTKRQKIDCYLWYSGMFHGGVILADLLLGHYRQAFLLFLTYTAVLVALTVYLKICP